MVIIFLFLFYKVCDLIAFIEKIRVFAHIVEKLSHQGRLLSGGRRRSPPQFFDVVGNDLDFDLFAQIHRSDKGEHGIPQNLLPIRPKF